MEAPGRTLVLVAGGADARASLRGVRGDARVVEVDDDIEMRRACSQSWDAIVVAPGQGASLGGWVRSALGPEGSVYTDLRDVRAVSRALAPLHPVDGRLVGPDVQVRFARTLGPGRQVPLETRVAEIVADAVRRSERLRAGVDPIVSEVGGRHGWNGVGARARAVSRGVGQLAGMAVWWARSRGGRP